MMKGKGKKKRKRADTAAVSLLKFASARQSGAQRIKKRTQRENSKTVNEYKKLVKKLGNEGKQVLEVGREIHDV